MNITTFDKRVIKQICVSSGFFLIGLGSSVTLGQDASSSLLSLSLEDLMQIEVTSISRRSQVLTDTSAAIYVLTADDISNSTALTIPDLLRTVPGVEVAQLDANKWAVSARGFNSRLLSKVLVIIDGRAVYSPTSGAVFWESDDLMLENIERIEIIRGPGATIWGANALNGVINVTTKSAHETKGSYSSLQAGNQYQRIINVRNGGELAEGVSYRIYGKAKSHDGFDSFIGGSADDDWESQQAGFRIDGAINASNKFTLQGDVVDQDINQRQSTLFRQGSVMTDVANPVDFTGMNIIGRWDYSDSNGGNFSTQLFYDYRDKKDLVQIEKVKTYDLDVKYTNRDKSRHNLTIGAGVRLTEHNTTSTPYFSHAPEDETLKLYNLSLHDDFQLNERTILGFGLKVENNIYTGTELQPNLRMNYALTDNQNAWVALSRAVRTPSRGERNAEVPIGYIPAASNPLSPFDVYVELQANDNFDVEKLDSLEIGWRWSSGNNLTFDVASYYNKYSELRNIALGQPYCNPDPFCLNQIDYVVQPGSVVNQDNADSKGIEAVVKWQQLENLSFELGYSYFEIDYDGVGSFFTDQAADGLNPARNQPLYKYNLQSNWQINPQMHMNLVYRYVSEPGISNISDYHAVDAQYVWEPNDSFNLIIAARNLGSGDHQEFGTELLHSIPTKIGAGYFVNLMFSW